MAAHVPLMHLKQKKQSRAFMAGEMDITKSEKKNPKFKSRVPLNPAALPDRHKSGSRSSIVHNQSERAPMNSSARPLSPPDGAH